MKKISIDLENTENKRDVIPIVNSYNEWDPLEEVIVGVIEGASVPSWHISLKATLPEKQWKFYQEFGGKPFPKEQVEAAKNDLEEFVHILESEGVIVRRPDVMDHNVAYSAPGWQSPGGLYAAMPRDTLLVIGDEIIEAPMAWRARYFESFAFRRLIKDYFKKGARWTTAPKPQLSDELYNYDYEEPGENQEMSYVITEFEPTFDAADFIKCGRDIFVQKSHVTNEFGINWLRRHLGDKYRIHILEVNDRHPMHIDASFMPLAPGKLLLNARRVLKIPGMFKSWDVLYAPEPCIPQSHTLYMTSPWINMNVLMLDHERVIVEKNEESITKALKNFGLKPIPCPFVNFNTFGGSFHCASLDIRRRGVLQSYF
ncbi:MAG: amidinotransferase [Candidatus Aminicenantes bacterium]|nr:amidinotransferase [Candidatus Aminicenantes bacterium]NIM84711.1 amidinotransferase [Candidatus Aminicenantes bacterium]NIN24205.1 amidinotransferase [Candidatus Aminicenantes bacterium]NIN47930.1 amidinotransferase [Candidatus Aminicenantes bacterium]NIN90868.1 amidinotransferase [Candidatus Aminicenantes bacterium]